MQVTSTLVVPRWGDPRRPVPTAASVAAVEPRPCQGEVIRAPASNALRGTNGFLCSLRVDALCKDPSVPQRCLNCPEARSPQTVWRWLARSLRLPPRPVHERVALRGTAGSLRSSLASSPLSSAFSPDFGLQTPGSSRLLHRLNARTLRAPLYRA